MKTHRELLGKYHEAAWALAMEQVAIRQGDLARELEERLDRDPEAGVPEHTVRRCRAVIRRGFAPGAGRRVKRTLSRLLVAAVLCAAMAVAAWAFSPQVREFLSDVFAHVAQTFTAVTFRDPREEDVGGNQGKTDQIYHGIRFEWLPEGYWYEGGEVTRRLQQVNFTNDRSESICVRITDANGSAAATYDDEVGKGIGVEIGGIQGWLVEEDGGSTVFWVDDASGKYLSVFASELSQTQLLQLCRGLRY